MPLSSYQVNVLDRITGAPLIVLDPTAFYTMRYNRELNGVGKLVITLPATDMLVELFDTRNYLDNFIEVFRTDPANGELALEEVYMLRLNHLFREGNEERLVIGALSLNHLLMRRIVDPEDDPLSVDGYSSKEGPADSVMREYVIEQCGTSASVDRRYPNFT